MGDTGRVSLELVTRNERKALNVELVSVEQDREAGDSERLVALYPGSQSVLFDADRREIVALQSGDVVLATRESRALVRRGKGLLFYDADTHAELPLAVTLSKYPDLLVTRPFVFISPVLVNLELGAVVGSSQARPLALSSSGHLLLADSEAEGPNLARGPLRWVSPPNLESAP